MKIWYSCNQHVDIVIEEIVDQLKSAPVLEVTNTSHPCYWCGKRAIYQLQIFSRNAERKYR